MHSNTILFLTMMFFIISLSNAKTVYMDKDNPFEVSGENASVFLHSTNHEHSQDFGKREIGRHCVPCKFGINQCCEPNICKKKRFWFDECMEIKVPRPKPIHKN